MSTVSTKNEQFKQEGRAPGTGGARPSPYGFPGRLLWRARPGRMEEMTVPLDTVNDIRSMDAAGRSRPEIARVLRVSRGTVAKYSDMGGGHAARRADAPEEGQARARGQRGMGRERPRGRPRDPEEAAPHRQVDLRQASRRARLRRLVLHCAEARPRAQARRAAAGGARLLFQVFADAYKRQSVVITTNLEFSRWGSVFGDDQMVAAVIDRIVHHGRLIQFRGESYRVRHVLMREG